MLPDEAGVQACMQGDSSEGKLPALWERELWIPQLAEAVGAGLCLTRGC